jgi:hypothetical protein
MNLPVVFLGPHVPLLGLSVLYLFAVLPIAVFWGLALSVCEHACLQLLLYRPSMRSPSRTPATGLRWASSSSPPSWSAISPRAREHFDRIVAPAPAGSSHGFTPKELQWILVHAPSETLILRPDPTLAEEGQLARTLEAVA